MKKILHVLNTAKLSGAENVAADICMMFDGEYEMYYCSLQGEVKKALKDRGVNYIPLNKLTVSELKRVISRIKPDIIHAHDVKATLVSTVATKKLPIVSHLHVNQDNMKKKTLKASLFLLSSLRVKKIVAVSEGSVNDFAYKRFIVNKSTILQNIIHTNRVGKLIVKDTNEYNFDFIFLGRLSNQKNPQRVAKVASKVLEKRKDVRFGIIGEGEFKEEMINIFKKEGVLERVTFTGGLSYPYKAIMQSKCMLFCSRFEGTPIAGLEAMSLGVPIVSTPTDGMKELIINNQTGFLSDDDDTLVQSIINLITQKDLNDKMSKNAKEKFEKINDEEQYKKSLIKIYEEL
ncbi:GalNAc-alpha-(1-_4)-GalNAc-alpha-(1-_3)-diNAcBac-PP-undecaprenol alpha-1,4-N-acetyl-D-galactosaminyltransferase [Jeotgalibaca dankookensis]|uniref:GalNAc-alpha-(1->4)-GalNAc-alpha-(1->3)-diNAcBac-PP-undecaprenol alpha-1,4-N-acetyl-D-galactosaminyltransferase n=1 Tax=Jeotgalibaca dankookensis TaxID=708126 RepID=A0A1S6IM65_9LACT|nr:glycosyltransferase [Jeotgalibaca dankookensis]AQS52642.1 GalNAc-alpha-(1->4)-GalNAc-alpha-(1->3)-diNAcBac-PP-undecaprenol alpha-1,4-N-acetyl-D-galactosaminyltransferase [Jeotgalibaca dankookensis]